MKDRISKINRKTKETDITVSLNLDKCETTQISTGIGFLDHLFTALSRHGQIGLELKCKGDLEIDDHHTSEDCAIVIGQALKEALGDMRGIVRFASAHAPLDEALARSSVDLSGRPFCDVNLQLTGEKIGDLKSENVSHIITSIAINAGICIHLDVLKGTNDHHRSEAAFKALALSLKQAVRLTGSNEIPSTKGTL